ncbi:MAG: hypothetical protein JXR10_16945 [Cyclobacteriaceae bacterium]
MKRLAVYSISIFIMIISVHSQILKSSSYFEKTVLNLQAGFSSGVGLNDKLEVGGFYQKEITGQEFHELISHPTIEKIYLGVYIQHPILRYEGSPLNLNIRTGVLNHKKLLIAPSLRYDIPISRHSSIDIGLGGAGIGSGNFRPTMFVGFKFSTS